MKVPRFRISWLMVLVAFVAVDFAAIRALSPPQSEFNDLMLVGVLPMLNVLFVCGLIARFRHENRPFLLGFVAFGASALIGYIVCSLVFTISLCVLLANAIEAVSRPLLLDGGPVPDPIVYVIASIMTVLPQLLIAWLGGYLSTKYKLVVMRREPLVAMPEESLVGSADF